MITHAITAGRYFERLLLTPAENTEWQDFKTDWNTKYATVVSNKIKKIRDSSAIEEKNDARDAFNDWVVDKNMNKLNRSNVEIYTTPYLQKLQIMLTVDHNY